MTEYFSCDLDDLEPQRCVRVEIGGQALVLARIDDQVFAIADRCSHEDVPLSEGELDAEEGTIECWRHGSVFDVRTGKALSLPAEEGVPVFRVSVSGSRVMVEVPAGA